MMTVPGVLHKGFPREVFLFLRAKRQGLLSKVKKLVAFFPLVVESIRAPWERLCPPGKVIAPRVLPLMMMVFTHFGEGLPAGKSFCF